MQSDIPDGDRLANVLSRFREFLIESWPALQAILRNHDWDGDAYFLEEWLDQNWCLLVGRQLFGKKANLQPLCVCTNDIKMRKYQFCIRSEAPIVGIFVSMGSHENGFSLTAPFDQVKILRDDGIEEILPFSSVSFRVCECTDLPPTPDSQPSIVNKGLANSRK